MPATKRALHAQLAHGQCRPTLLPLVSPTIHLLMCTSHDTASRCNPQLLQCYSDAAARFDARAAPASLMTSAVMLPTTLHTQHQQHQRMHGTTTTSPAARTATNTSTLAHPLLLALLMQVGSADAIIRIFQQEEMMDSLQEADEVVTLCSLGGSRWGYALANGTIGLYEGTRRVWRYKSKHVPVCCAAFDLDGDGQVEMVSGWSSGKVGACCWG